MTDAERFAAQLVAEITETAEALGFSEVILLPYDAGAEPAEIAA